MQPVKLSYVFLRKYHAEFTFDNKLIKLNLSVFNQLKHIYYTYML